jgi:hypothetical protein
MAEISRLSRLVNAAQRNVDLASNTLVVGDIKIGGSGGTLLTKAILDALIASQFLLKVSANDTTGGYLNGKLVAGSGISFTENNDGANETLTISSSISQYTDEMAQDAVGGALTDSATIDFTYNDGANTISASVVDASITDAKLASDSVTTAKILNANVTADKLAADSVITAKILDANVTADKLAANSVTTAKILDANVTSAKLATGIDASKLADGSVSNAEFQYINSLSSNAQDQLDAKVAKAGSSMNSAANLTFSGGGEVLGLPATPSAAGAAASKAYVDAVALGLSPKKAVRVATLVAGTLASSFEDGDVVDGVTLATGDRILIKDQAAPAQNGIYVVQASGAPVRATDFDSVSPIDEINGAWVPVQAGSQVGKVFVQYGVVATIGTDPISFDFYNPIASLIGGDMVSVTGSTISLDLASAGGLESSNAGDPAGQLQIKLDGATLAKSASGLKVSAGGISSTELATDAVIAVKIAADAVTTAKILNANVTADKLAADSVTTAKILNANVTADKLAADSVTTAKILDANVTADKLAADSVTTAKILNANVTTDKLAATSVTAAKLGSDVAGAGLTGGNGSAIAIDFAVSTADEKAWKASVLSASAGAAKIGFDNTAAALAGSPATVQAAIEALDSRLDGISSDKVISKNQVAGEAFAASSLFAVRWAKSGETAGRLYKATNDASGSFPASDKFHAVGLMLTSGALSAADTAADVVKLGEITVTAHGFTVGEPLFLDAAGALTSTAPSAADTAVVIVGIVKSANIIDVSIREVGIN